MKLGDDEERRVLENARLLVELAQTLQESNADTLNRKEQLNNRAFEKVNKTQRQIEGRVLGSNSCIDAKANVSEKPSVASEPEAEVPDLDAVDYLEASTLDRSPISVLQVETYFARFGTLRWCFQAASSHTVIFKFADDGLTQLALNYGHFIDRKPLALQAMMNGGVPLGKPSVAEPALAKTSSTMTDATS